MDDLRNDTNLMHFRSRCQRTNPMILPVVKRNRMPNMMAGI